MTSEGLGEMFEGDSADSFDGKFLLMSIGGRAEAFAFANPGRGPPSVSKHFKGGEGHVVLKSKTMILGANIWLTCV